MLPQAIRALPALAIWGTADRTLQAEYFLPLFTRLIVQATSPLRMRRKKLLPSSYHSLPPHSSNLAMSALEAIEMPACGK